MHLTREADAGDRIGRDAAFRQHRTDRLPARPPPVVGILLGPGGSRRSERGVVRRRRPEQAAVVVEDQGARAARADVDAENRNGRISSAGRGLRRWRSGQRPRIKRGAATDEDVLAAIDFARDRRIADAADSRMPERLAVARPERQHVVAVSPLKVKPLSVVSTPAAPDRRRPMSWLQRILPVW